MFHLAWRTLVREVYKKIRNGYPARDYVLTSMCLTRNHLCNTYGEVLVIVENYVKDMLSNEFWMQVIGKKTKNLTDPPHRDYLERMMPVIRHHYNEASKRSIPENITHYLRLIMCGCYNIYKKNVIDYFASDSVTCIIQASCQEHLPMGNLFDNYLLVVSISCLDTSLVTTYSTFLEQTCIWIYSLIQVKTEHNIFYRTMLLFRFTGELLDCANAKGIHPIIEGDPEYFGFSDEDMDMYGYYFLFVINLPAYTKNIWVLENADYLELMPVKERQRQEK
jgi:hypothetical protein